MKTRTWHKPCPFLLQFFTYILRLLLRENNIGGNQLERFPDYKVGVFFGRSYGDRTVHCSCGRETKVERGQATICAGCGNTNVSDGGYYATSKRFHDGIYTVIDKDDKSFHVRKQEIIVNVSNGVVRPKVSHVWELKYDIIQRTASMTKNGEPVPCTYHNHLNISQFFKAVKSDYRLIDIIGTDRSRYLFEFAYKKYGCVHYERTKMLGRALMRFLASDGVGKLELFTNAGFGDNLSNIHRESDWMRSAETKPHKILGVPKYLLQPLRELDRFGGSDVRNLLRLDKAISGTNVKILLEIFKEESTARDLLYAIDTFLSLYNDYGYKDIRRTGMYLAREVKLEQGISSPSSAAILLRDYIRMCRDMEIEPREKYPKSLKKLHDIAQMNFSVKADPKKNEDIKAVIETPSYRGLEYKKKPYAIVAPLDANEIIKEGSSLSHCVASYVNDVISERCKILFLRQADDVGKPLVTIEVRENNIRQVRGAYNRSALGDEMAFVREWAEKKNLVVATR